MKETPGEHHLSGGSFFAMKSMVAANPLAFSRVHYSTPARDMQGEFIHIRLIVDLPLKCESSKELDALQFFYVLGKEAGEH
ncbi:MAG: hypothetical protein K2P16_03220, partial [Lawsonibacter sp.]|nr:hypothetical protein [Lawsonibacter sp.]